MQQLTQAVCYQFGVFLLNLVFLVLHGTAVHAEIEASPPVNPHIFFECKVAGPVTNICAYDASADKLKQVTTHTLWRDIDLFVSPQQTILFSSNRRNDQQVDLKRTGEVFNVYMASIDSTVAPVSTSDHQEVMPRRHINGEWVTYVRQVNDQQWLIVRNAHSTEETVAHKADAILGVSMHPTEERVVVSDKQEGKSRLVSLQLASGEMKVLLTRPAMKKAGKQRLSESESTSNRIKTHTDPGEYYSPTWSPNGQWLAYIDHPLVRDSVRELRILDMATEKFRPISLVGAQVQNGVSWSADSSQVLYSALINYAFRYDEKHHRKIYDGSMQLFLSDAKTGKTQQLTQGEHLHRAPVFSPDENSIAYLFGETLNARTLSLKTMTKNGSEDKVLYKSVSKSSNLFWE